MNQDLQNKWVNEAERSIMFDVCWRWLWRIDVKLYDDDDDDNSNVVDSKKIFW